MASKQLNGFCGGLYASERAASAALSYCGNATYAITAGIWGNHGRDGMLFMLSIVRSQMMIPCEYVEKVGYIRWRCMRRPARRDNVVV